MEKKCDGKDEDTLMAVFAWQLWYRQAAEQMTISKEGRRR